MQQSMNATVIKWASISMFLTVNIAVGSLAALVLILHDGAATAGVVDTLKWIAVSGIVSYSAITGMHTWASGVTPPPPTELPPPPPSPQS